MSRLYGYSARCDLINYATSLNASYFTSAEAKYQAKRQRSLRCANVNFHKVGDRDESYLVRFNAINVFHISLKNCRYLVHGSDFTACIITRMLRAIIERGIGKIDEFVSAQRLQSDGCEPHAEIRRCLPKFSGPETEGMLEIKRKYGNTRSIVICDVVCVASCYHA